MQNNEQISWYEFWRKIRPSASWLRLRGIRFYDIVVVMCSLIAKLPPLCVLLINLLLMNTSSVSTTAPDVSVHPVAHKLQEGKLTVEPLPSDHNHKPWTILYSVYGAHRPLITLSLTHTGPMIQLQLTSNRVTVRPIISLLILRSSIILSFHYSLLYFFLIKIA